MAEGFLLLLVAILAGVAGGVAGVFFARIRTASAVAEARATAERDLATAQERTAGLERRATDLQARLEAADAGREQLRAALANAEARVAQLETALAHERRAAEEKLAVLADAQRQLSDAFKALSADALKSNNTAFLDLARQTFERLQQQSSGDLEKRQQAIDGLVRPLRESLEKVDAKIAEIEAARARSHGQLGQQLEQLNTAQLRLQAEAARLSTALRSTTYAGSWGELQLRRVVEMADMLAYVDFVEQETAGALRADMVVRLPAGQRIVVDAKAPLQSYRAAMDAPDEAVRATLMADHAQKVRGHIDALGAKNYWEQFQPAPEFVVLFVPGDHFLSAALQSDPTLLERAIARRVLLATPTTLIALLKAAAYGWRQEEVSLNAEEISAIGRELHKRLSVFADHLDRAGRGLDSAVKSYNAAVGSFEQSLLPGARRFAELGARDAKELSAPRTVDAGARDVTKRE